MRDSEKRALIQSLLTQAWSVEKARNRHLHERSSRSQEFLENVEAEFHSLLKEVETANYDVSD